MSLAMAGKVLGNSAGFVTTARPGIRSMVMCEIMVLKSHQSGLVARLSDTPPPPAGKREVEMTPEGRRPGNSSDSIGK